MIESDRLISAKAGEYEEVHDRAIRPTLLSEYVGQPTVREQVGAGDQSFDANSSPSWVPLV